MKRSGGVENLAETGSSSEDGATSLGRGRSRSRLCSYSSFAPFFMPFHRGRSTGRGVEEADGPRFLGPQVELSTECDVVDLTNMGNKPVCHLRHLLLLSVEK